MFRTRAKALNVVYGICLITFVLCMYAEERVSISYGLFFTLKLQNATLPSRSVQAF